MISTVSTGVTTAAFFHVFEAEFILIFFKLEVRFSTVCFTEILIWFTIVFRVLHCLQTIRVHHETYLDYS